MLNTALIPHPHQKKNKENTKPKNLENHSQTTEGSVNLVDAAQHPVTKETDKFFVLRKPGDIFKLNAMMNKHVS